MRSRWLACLLWCLLCGAAHSESSFEYRIQAAPDGTLARLQLTFVNQSRFAQRVDLPVGMPFVPMAGQGPTLYLCKPVNLDVKAGARAEVTIPAIPGGGGAPIGSYRPADTDLAGGPALLVSREAKGGPERWKQLASALAPGGGGDPALRSLVQKLDSRARAGRARYQGKRALLRRDYAAAITFFTQAVGAEASAEDYRLRSEAYQRQGQYQLACNDADAALRLDPRNEEALLRRAYARIYLKRLREALGDLNRILANNPKHSRAYRYRANVRDQLGLPGVLEDYNRSLRLNPFDAPTYHFRSMFRESHGDRPGALQDSEKAVDLDQNNSGYVGWRGHMRGVSGDVPAALNDLRRALELNSANSQARADLQRWGGGR